MNWFDNFMSENTGGNNWREIAAQAWCDETTKTVEMDVRLAAVFADMLEKAYRLGVTNATGILRQNEITEKEAEEEGYQWTRTFPQETADGIEEVLLSNGGGDSSGEA